MQNSPCDATYLEGVIGILMVCLIGTPALAERSEARMFRFFATYCMKSKLPDPKAEKVSRQFARSCQALGKLPVNELNKSDNTMNAICYLRGTNSGFQIIMAGPAPGINNKTYGYFCSVRAMIKRVRKNSKLSHLPDQGIIKMLIRNAIKKEVPSIAIESERHGIWTVSNGAEIMFDKAEDAALAIRYYRPDPRISRR